MIIIVINYAIDERFNVSRTNYVLCAYLPRCPHAKSVGGARK